MVRSILLSALLVGCGERSPFQWPAMVVAHIAPQNLVADGDHIYYASYGEIGRFASDGSADPEMLFEADLSNSPSLLAVDATHVYWVHYPADFTTQLRRLRKSGGEAQTLATLQGELATALVVSDDDAYIMSWEQNTDSKILRSVNKESGTTTELTRSDTVEDACALAVDDQYAYFASGACSRMTGSAASLYYVSKQGGTVQTYADGAPVMFTGEKNYTMISSPNILVEPEHILWVLAGEHGAIASAPRGQPGGTANILAAAENPGTLVAGGSKIYWVEGSSTDYTDEDARNGKVRSLEWNVESVSEPKDLTPGNRTPLALTIDGAYVYWSDSWDGRTYRVPR